MQSLPTGTVSFLFTDVAASTRLWDADREGMAASLAAHDRVLTEAIAAHDGYVFSTAGDSFGAAFRTASAAIAAAVQAQLALHGEPWEGPPIRVRMGIHTGSSQERDGNYFGPDVNRAARVMSAANGGQILISAATAELVPDLVAPLFLADRGVHALKDLDRPEHLLELRHPGLPEVAGPLHTLDADRVHLPAQLTSFVGRAREVADVTSLLDHARLVTLTGAGGTGKTRLALEASSHRGDDFPDGIWLVELAAVTDGEFVESEVAALWDLRPGDGIALIKVITGHLAARRLLLVVDNCEHVLGAAVPMIARILAECPEVSVLATSRESLGIPGEAVYRVPSLGLPGDGGDAGASDAVRLFVDRAQRVRPGFEPSDGDLAAIVRICRRLDGIPLGIELAAARLRTLSPTELADRLDDSFRILLSKTAVPRQRTLETAIDWSHDLLDDDEAALFRRLSVFAEGFDLAAAEAVGGGNGIEAWQILDLLDQLVDKSLVVVADHGGVTRYRLLEPIRRYAQERLTAAGEAEASRLAHAGHYATVVAATAPRLRGPEQRQANADLMTDIDNIRFALATLVDEGEIDRALVACFDLVWFWGQASLQVEGREFVLSALQSAGEAATPAAAAKGWWTAALLAVYLTDPRAVEYADRGIESAKAAGDDALLGWLLVQRGIAQRNVGTAEDATPWIQSGARLIETAGGEPLWDAEWDATVLHLMFPFGGAGTPEEQRAHLEEAVARALDLEDGYMAAMAMTTASYLVGSVDDAWIVEMLRRAVDALRDLGFRHALGHALFYLGIQTGRVESAADLDSLAEASTILGEVGDIPCSTWAAVPIVRTLLDRGDSAEAAAHLDAAARRLLGFERAVTADIATLACRLAVARDDTSRAARFLGHAEAVESADSAELVSVRSAIEAALPADELERLRTEGAAADRRRMLGWITS